MLTAKHLLLERLPGSLAQWRDGHDAAKLMNEVVGLFESAAGCADYAVAGPKGVSILCMWSTRSPFLNPPLYVAESPPALIIRCIQRIMAGTPVDRAHVARELGQSGPASASGWHEHDWNLLRQGGAPCAAILEFGWLFPTLANLKVVMRRWRAYTHDMIARFARQTLGERPLVPVCAPRVQQRSSNATIVVHTVYGHELMDAWTWANLTFEIFEMDHRAVVETWLARCFVHRSAADGLASIYLHRIRKHQVRRSNSDGDVDGDVVHLGSAFTRSTTRFLLQSAYDADTFFLMASDDYAYEVYVRQRRPAMQLLFSNDLSAAKINLLVWESDLTLDRMLVINYRWLFRRANGRLCRPRNIASAVVSTYVMRRMFKTADGSIRIADRVLPHPVSDLIVSFCWFNKRRL